MIKQQQLLALVAGSSILLFSSITSPGEEKSRLVSNLEAGKKQTVVAYGTSLTAGGAWVGQFSNEMNRRYPGMVSVINSGQSSMWSTWGVENLQERVIKKQPDAVFIEFSINDAFSGRKTSVPQARSNLVTMVDRILATNKTCEIILMVMNPTTGGALAWRPQLDAHNQMYRDVAAQRRVMLIDHWITGFDFCIPFNQNRL